MKIIHEQQKGGYAPEPSETLMVADIRYDSNRVIQQIWNCQELETKCQRDG